MTTSSIRAQVAELLGEDVLAPDPEDTWRRPSPKRLPVAQAALNCPRLGIVAAEDMGAEVAVAVLADGTTVILPDECPHDGGLLSDGFVEENRIVCARHGWEFDGHTGQCSHQRDVQVACLVFAESTTQQSDS